MKAVLFFCLESRVDCIQTQRHYNPGDVWLTSRKSGRSNVWSVAPTHRSPSPSCCYQRYATRQLMLAYLWEKSIFVNNSAAIKSTRSLLTQTVCVSVNPNECHLFYEVFHPRCLLQFTRKDNLLIKTIRRGESSFSVRRWNHSRQKLDVTAKKGSYQ